MLKHDIHYVVSVIVRSDEGNNISSRCSSLLHNMLLYASSFTYSYRPKVFSADGDAVLGLFSTIEDNGVKRLLMYGKIEDRKRYIDTLNYLAELNEHSILTSNTIMVIEKLLEEVYRPQYISWAHTSLKKNTPIVVYEDIKDYIDEETTISIDSCLYSCKCLENYVNVLIENLIPLTIVSLHSGIHRYKQAINQVVFQTLTYYIGLLLNSYEGRECKCALQILQKLLKYTMLLQSAIVADTYVWMPYIWNLKAGAFQTEFLHSIASQPLAELIDRIKHVARNKKIVCIFRKVQKTYLDNAVGKLNLKKLSEKYDTTNLIDLIGKVEDIIRNTICDVFNYKLESETLIGRLRGLSNKIPSRKYDNLVLLATEQTSILLLGVLSKIMGVKRFYILYTPQTLYQILLLISLGLKSGKCKSILLNNIQLHYVPIPSSEPYVCESILENLLGNIDEKNTFFLLQGPSIVTMPLYLKLLEYHVRNENILLY